MSGCNCSIRRVCAGVRTYHKPYLRIHVIIGVGYHHDLSNLARERLRHEFWAPHFAPSRSICMIAQGAKSVGQ